MADARVDPVEVDEDPDEPDGQGGTLITKASNTKRAGIKSHFAVLDAVFIGGGKGGGGKPGCTMFAGALF